MKEKTSYEESLKKIEAIIVQLESGEVEIDKLGDLIKNATEILAQCQETLKKIETDIEKKLEDL